MIGVSLGAAGAAALVVGVAVASQVVWWRYAARIRQRLTDNIKRLETIESELRTLVDDLPDAVVVLSADGVIREANALAMALTGRPREELIGRHFADTLREQDRDKLIAQFIDVLSGIDFDSPMFEVPGVDQPGRLVEASVNYPVSNFDRIVVSLHDVTEREEHTRMLETARERFKLAFHGAPIGMAVSRAHDGQLIEVNEQLASMLGYEVDELIGRTVRDLTHPDDWAQNEIMLNRVALGQADGYRLEKRYVRKDGQLLWARARVSVMTDSQGQVLAIAHVEDITEQRLSAEQLEFAATHDGLTRLPNRFRFLEQLGQFLDTSEPGAVAVLFIDIDNFKVINDSLGHTAGDQLLMGLSERLRAVVRDRDLLGRFGGDEFIVMLRDISAAMSPVDIAERLRAEIAMPMTVDNAELYVTASIGIAVADRVGVTTTELLRDADTAMYRAKARGRDCVEVFSPASHDASVLTLRTTSELRRGLERGEIMPYYQPIVDLAGGQLVGFEVLARWRHPDRGLLGPDQFLPMAEETGLINEVGAAMLRTSLSQLGQWRDKMPRFADLSVSVNVSVRQLMSGRFHDIVGEALAESGVNAGALWLEITESALMSDVKAATVALRELRGLGLHLAVDDFGTGYSSLTYLKRFPVEAIKIDRSFISGLGIDAEDSTIVDAVVKLGRSLGLLVVAEGVETPLQLTRLREIGCDRGQGYLFGRPRPANLIESEYALVDTVP